VEVTPSCTSISFGSSGILKFASAEWAAIASKLGHIPTVAKYHEAMGIVNKGGAAIYKYLNFNQIAKYVENAKGVTA
jgi:aconitate hydratase 2/2-methylisocitrate dehydratase